jgi:hypothetical protein
MPADDMSAVSSAPNEPAAAVVLGRLEEAGIPCITQPAMGALRGAWQPRTIYVRTADLESARAALGEGRA